MTDREIKQREFEKAQGKMVRVIAALSLLSPCQKTCMLSSLVLEAKEIVATLESLDNRRKTPKD